MGRGLVDNNKLECHFDNCAAGLGFVVVDILGRMGEVLVVVVGEVGVPGGGLVTYIRRHGSHFCSPALLFLLPRFYSTF